MKVQNMDMFIVPYKNKIYEDIEYFREIEVLLHTCIARVQK